MRDAIAAFMNTPQPYVIVLDDHPLVGRGMAHYLKSIRPDLAVSVATQWGDVHRLQQAHGCPSLLVADVWLADGSSLQALERWCADCPAAACLAVSGDDDPAVVTRVRAAGAWGFVHKQAPPDTFGAAISAVMAGGRWYDPEQAPRSPVATIREWTVSPAELGLTLRQGEILRLVMCGLPNKRIASQLSIAESTVKEHVTGILERLGVRSRVEAIAHLRGRRLSLPDKP
jgi:DNA-binding NarL/FixJ family response regulator